MPFVGNWAAICVGEHVLLRADRADRHELADVRVGAAEVGAEHPQPDVVGVLELVEGADRRLLGEVEAGLAVVRAGSPIEPEMSSTSSTRASLRSSAHESRMPTSTSGDGTSSSAVGWFGSTPLAATIGSASGTVGLFGRNPYSSTLLLVLGQLDERPRTRAAAAFSSSSTHSVSSTMNGLSENSVPSSG